SPSRTDPDCVATYERSFAAAASRIVSERVHLIGLGCGGGQKDSRLLGLLRKKTKALFYTPADVSAAMVLIARQAALAAIPDENCFPLVCDLATAEELSVISKPGQRLITFFGMMPNFEPHIVLPKLAALLGERGFLLLSANLASGDD